MDGEESPGHANGVESGRGREVLADCGATAVDDPERGQVDRRELRGMTGRDADDRGARRPFETCISIAPAAIAR